MRSAKTTRGKFGTYAEMTQNKDIVPVLSSGRFDITKELFSTLIDVAIGPDGFDESWYLTQYPDIRKGLDEKIIRSGRWHYCRFGYFEHRLPRMVEVDAAFYAAEYPDIGMAIKEGRVPSAQWHFEHFGVREGRLPSAGFTLFTL